MLAIESMKDSLTRLQEALPQQSDPMPAMPAKMDNKQEPNTPPPEYEEKVSLGQCAAFNTVVVVPEVDWPLMIAQKIEKDAAATNSEYIIEKTYPDDNDDADGEATDPWKMPEMVDDQNNEPKFSELSPCGKIRCVFVGYIGKIIILLGLLYLFICSLDFLSSAFRLVGGKAAGEVFRSNTLLQNPVAGLMIGIVATVLLQSSSTSTSIVVTMVASGIMDVKPAIPIIMGANIGTSVTNTICSIPQATDRDTFRRAFAGATVHDMFNWLSVLVLLPAEIATGMIYEATLASTQVFAQGTGSRGFKQDLLKTLTKPFTKLIIQLDKHVLEAIATGDEEGAKGSLIKKWCDYDTKVELVNSTNVNGSLLFINGSSESITYIVNQTVKVPTKSCTFLLNRLDDLPAGILLLATSLTLLCVCLLLMVKLLSSMLQGPIAKVIKKAINADFPGCCSYFTGYVAIAVGAGMTFLVQSSSVFTSAMTPLVGLGVIEIERMYPLTLGSNIGTTATGILAALTAPSDKLAASLQIAFAHLFFNVFGIIIFYPVPQMRIPINLAKILGNTTADYRWFAVFYLFMMFFILPAFVFVLCLLGLIPCAIVLGILLLFFIIIIIINILQEKRPSALPRLLRSWEFLPECLHSLDPMDRVFTKLIRFFRKIFPCKACQPKKPEFPDIISSSEIRALADAREMTESVNPSPFSSQNNSQSTSVCSSQATSACNSRSTSMSVLTRSSNI